MLRFILGLLSIIIIPCNIHAQDSAVNSISIEHHNVSGGGFQSDVTITEDGLTVYSAADVSGIFKSSDGGLLFENMNEGLKSPKVATIAITSDNDQILYAGTGDKGGSGGLFRSIDGGDTWLLTADGDKAQFAGNHSKQSDPVPDGHPRSNGDLIAIHEGEDASTFMDDIIIAGSYNSGVRIFIEGGEVEVSAVLTNGFVRSIAEDPAIPYTAYAAIYFEPSADEENGIYKIDYTDPSFPIATLEYQTAKPEGITVISSGRVYAAIGDGGIVKFNGTSWSLKNTGLDIGNINRQWTAITGYQKDNNDVVYAGLVNSGGNANGENYSSIWRTVNNGNTWTPLVDANTNVIDTILGQTYEWWFRTNAFPQAGLGRRNSVVSSIDVARGPWPDVVSDDIIYVSGRGGIWKSENGGDFWKPAVYNMQATANRGVAVNPNDPSQIAIANTDFVVLETGSAFEEDDVSRDKPSGAESRAYDAIFDASSDALIIGVGDRDSNTNGGGEVYTKSAILVGNPSDAAWTNLNIQSETNDNNGRVKAVTVGYHDGNNPTSQTIIAAVEEEGIFRYHNNVWTKSNGVELGTTKRSNLIWPDRENSGVVYLLDLGKGFFRSNDGGSNWTNIWPSMDFNDNDFYNTGYLTADDADPTTLYLSIQGRSGSPIGTGFRVYRMTGADTSIFGEPGTVGITDITVHSGDEAIQRPGPIVIAPDGRLWLTQQQNSANGIDAGLFVMDNPATDTSFTDLSTNAYKNIAIQPSGIDVSSDGYVYISQSGTGLVKVKYDESFTDLTTTMTMIPTITNGLSNLYTTIQIQELGNLATSDQISIVLPKDDRMAINWDPNATTLGPFPINNAIWTYTGTNPNFHIWTTDNVIAAGGISIFGFESSFDPANTSGQVSYSGTILAGSGGEVNGINNIDSEMIIYFAN